MYLYIYIYIYAFIVKDIYMFIHVYIYVYSRMCLHQDTIVFGSLYASRKSSFEMGACHAFSFITEVMSSKNKPFVQNF